MLPRSANTICVSLSLVLRRSGCQKENEAKKKKQKENLFAPEALVPPEHQHHVYFTDLSASVEFCLLPRVEPHCLPWRDLLFPPNLLIGVPSLSFPLSTFLTFSVRSEVRRSLASTRKMTVKWAEQEREGENKEEKKEKQEH